MQTTVIADSVNLASRLENMTKETGSLLLVSRDVYNRLEDSDAFMTRFIGTTYFKGKEEKIGVFEVFDQDPGDSRQSKASSRKQFEAAVALVTENRKDEAEKAFTKIVAENPVDKAALWHLEQLRL